LGDIGAYSDFYADRYTDADAYGYGYGHAYGYCDYHAYSGIYGDAYGLGEYARAYVDAGGYVDAGRDIYTMADSYGDIYGGIACFCGELAYGYSHTAAGGD